MKGLQNLLLWLNNNWTAIIVVVGLLIGLYRKIKAYLGLTNDEKVVIAKKQVQEYILSLCAESEKNWAEYTKAGSVKRAEVISKIYAQYPILTTIIDQDSLLSEIDEWIDSALDEVRNVVTKETTVAVETQEETKGVD